MPRSHSLERAASARTRNLPSGSLFGVLLAVASLFVLPTATAQAQQSGDEQNPSSERGESGGDEEADSISDLPTSEKKRLLKLLQSAKQDYSQGNFEKVVTQMKEAYSIYPDPEFLFRIAISHEQTGDKKEAVRYYEKYLDEKPNSKKRGRVERSLENLRTAIRKEEKQKEKRAEKAAEAEESEPDEPPRTDTGGSNQSLPIILTSVGGAMTGASITFGVLNLQTKSTVDDIRSDPRNHGDESPDSFQNKVQQQNLYAGIAIGTGALAAGALTWAIVEWSSSSGSARSPADDSARAARSSARGSGLRLRLQLGPNSVGLTGEF